MVRLDGAVESSVRLGVADAVADVVSTGTTLRAAGLEIFGDPILKSEAILIRRADAAEEDIAVLTGRLRGVLMARQFVLVDYDVPNAHLEASIAVNPGMEAPTVTPLHGKDWHAVRVMVPRTEMNQIMDKPVRSRRARDPRDRVAGGARLDGHLRRGAAPGAHHRAHACAHADDEGRDPCLGGRLREGRPCVGWGRTSTP
ncbi:hypothetical protein GCM10025876_38420 [Demequina litorisediminis]|uniref:ATP phosphoribosyltransferase n=1 Tax=Demequina litorisediminis TaxID=1849022 RepID=A0ABQ6ILT1_9MICO|nr:hypothetical protein GCM10025876_38420 [Demequina litorisediminis]